MKSPFDDTQAVSEGWIIATMLGADSAEPYQLQATQNPEIGPLLLEDDDAAWLHVCTRAKEGSEYHIQALLWLREHSPSEYHNIGATMRKIGLEI